MIDDFVYNNEEEAEMGQLQAIHNNMNHIAQVQHQLALQSSRPALSHCEDCGEDIPELRQLAIPGVRRCVFCQEVHERH